MGQTISLEIGFKRFKSEHTLLKWKYRAQRTDPDCFSVFTHPFLALLWNFRASSETVLTNSIFTQQSLPWIEGKKNNTTKAISHAGAAVCGINVSTFLFCCVLCVRVYQTPSSRSAPLWPTRWSTNTKQMMSVGLNSVCVCECMCVCSKAAGLMERCVLALSES